MEIRLILFKEVGSGISLNNQPDGSRTKHVPFQEVKNQEDGFSFPK
jgi:hypothetical protein